MARWPALLRRCFLVVMLLGAALITAASLVYFDTDTLPPFVIEKFPLRFKALWLVSLRVHVASALLSFPLCLVLMTRPIQRRPAWHRWLGRITGALVLFALVPSGVVLAFDAKGGSLVTAGFLLSATIVAVGMVQGVVAARRRNLVSHRRAAWHVVAQMSVAVTSRALLIGLDAAGIDPELSYVISLWVPVLASAAVVELIAARPVFSSSSRCSERIRHENIPLALVNLRSVLPPVTRLGR
jgi:hypothetical protein